MRAADVDRALEIASNLTEAPHWTRSAYLVALDPLAVPLRIALVAEAGEPQLLIRQEKSDIAFPPFPAKDAGKDGARRQYLVAGSIGRLCGFAVASVVGEESELESIAVSADCQRQGVGRQLLAALAAAARKAGACAMLLEVRASNAPALGFYQSLGWSECGRRPRYYADPDEDALLLRLPLS
jgi:ribosomal-protein-alanine acetyltransferase